MMRLSVGGVREDMFALKLLIMALPLELAVAQLMHGLFKDFLPAPALLLHPLLALVVVLIVSRHLTRDDLKRQDSIVLMAVVLLAIPCVYHIAQGNWWDLRFLLLGVGSLLLGVMLAGAGGIRFVARPLAMGLIVWCVAVVLAFVADTFQLLDFHEGARHYSLDQLVLAMRYPDSIDLDLHYPKLTGNWNKASNIIVLASMFMMIAIYRDRPARPLFLTAMATMSVVSVLSYSRGGMLVSAGLGCFNLLLLLWIPQVDRRSWALAALVMILPLAVSFCLPAMRVAWFDMSSMDQRMVLAYQAIEFEALGLGAGSGGAWGALMKVVQPVLNLLLGIGVGTYGEKLVGNPFAGTHNMFLDMFIAGGLIQVLGLLVLIGYSWLVVLSKGLRSVTQMVGGMAILAVVVLAFREFDLNYLGVLALPALLFGWLIGEALGHPSGVASARHRERV